MSHITCQILSHVTCHGNVTWKCQSLVRVRKRRKHSSREALNPLSPLGQIQNDAHVVFSKSPSPDTSSIASGTTYYVTNVWSDSVDNCSEFQLREIFYGPHRLGVSKCRPFGRQTRPVRIPKAVKTQEPTRLKDFSTLMDPLKTGSNIASAKKHDCLKFPPNAESFRPDLQLQFGPDDTVSTPNPDPNSNFFA
jgi:hypothetical protein